MLMLANAFIWSELSLSSVAMAVVSALIVGVVGSWLLRYDWKSLVTAAREEMVDLTESQLQLVERFE